jgi:hypothetical protein
MIMKRISPQSEDYQDAVPSTCTRKKSVSLKAIGQDNCPDVFSNFHSTN